MNWKLMTYGAQVQNDKLWFSNNNFNGLFCMDITTKEIKLVSFFPDEKIERWAMHKKCLAYKNKLIFIPAYGNHIHIYDTSDEKVTAYQFDENEAEVFFDRVSDAVVSSEYVYILPMDYKGELRRFNMDTGVLEYIPEFMYQLRKEVFEEKKCLLTRADIDSKGCIRFALWDTDILCSYDISRNKLRTQRCGIDHIFSSHTIDDRSFVLTNSSDSVYEICADGSVKEFIGLGKGQEDDRRKYNRVIKFGSEIIVLPAFDDRLYAIKNEKLIEIAKLDLVCNESMSISSFETIVIDNDLWMLPFETNNCVVIRQDLSEKQRISFELTDVLSRKAVQQRIFCEKKEIMYENKNWELGDYISVVI